MVVVLGGHFTLLFFSVRDVPRDVYGKTKSHQAVLNSLRGDFPILYPRRQRMVVLQSIQPEVLAQLQDARLFFLDGAV